MGKNRGGITLLWPQSCGERKRLAHTKQGETWANKALEAS